MAVVSQPDSPVPHRVRHLSWRDKWLGIRDSILSNPGFQRFAATFALTRPIARRRSRELFDLCAGFVYSQILYSCVRLRVFDHLANGPRSAPELASLLSLPVDSVTLLLDAASSLRLVQRRTAGCYGLGPLGAALLGNPGVTAMIEHHAMLYKDLGDPIALLRRDARGGELARYWSYAGRNKPAELSSRDVAPYTALMSASQPMIAQQVINAYSFSKHRCLLDVGGGDGAFINAVAPHAPQLRFVLFDLPAVADKASERFRANDLSSRAVAIGGSFLSDRLPEGADVVSLIRIVHDHDDENAMTLLRAVRRTLPDGGKLILAEPMGGIHGAEPISDAYFAFYLMAMGSGRPRTFAQLSDMLQQAGFSDVRLLPARMPVLTTVITARVS